MEWSDGIDLPSLQCVEIGCCCFEMVVSVSFVSRYLSCCFRFRSSCPHQSHSP